MPDATITLHFGVESTVFEKPSLSGYSDPEVEIEIRLPKADETGYLSGSWSHWWPENQEAEGDYTLHFAVPTDRFVELNDTELASWLHELWFEVDSLTPAHCRLYDYAVMTAGDWHHTVGVVLFDSQSAIVFGGAPVPPGESHG